MTEHKQAHVCTEAGRVEVESEGINWSHNLVICVHKISLYTESRAQQTSLSSRSMKGSAFYEQ